jgi:hypothetical protein
VNEYPFIALAALADHFVEGLRRISDAPVVYFRLPGAQHAFGLFGSLRFDQVVNGIVAFLATSGGRK